MLVGTWRASKVSVKNVRRVNVNLMKIVNCESPCSTRSRNHSHQLLRRCHCAEYCRRAIAKGTLRRVSSGVEGSANGRHQLPYGAVQGGQVGGPQRSSLVLSVCTRTCRRPGWIVNQSQRARLVLSACTRTCAGDVRSTRRVCNEPIRVLVHTDVHARRMAAQPRQRAAPCCCCARARASTT